MIKEAISKIVEKKDLSKSEAKLVMDEIMDGKTTSEQIAALTLGSMLPRDEYFPYSFRALLATDGRNNTHRASTSKFGFTGPEASASPTIRKIKEGGVPTLLPYQPHHPVDDLALVDVRGAAIMLYEHLPRELLVAMRIGEQLAAIGTSMSEETKNVRRALVAERSTLQEKLKTDFGLDVFKLPNFSKLPENARVEKTLSVYFGSTTG